MSTKTFDHAVIYNGVLYPANTPIETVEKKAVKTDDNNGKPKKSKARNTAD